MSHEPPTIIDVLCVGMACYDLVFSVDHHPGPDEKATASSVTACGGGPAANAAVAASRLGVTTAFAGYLGSDIYGQAHQAEFDAEGVQTEWVVKGADPTPISAILVKPDGLRTVVNYSEETPGLDPGHVDLSHPQPRVLLLDGHQPAASVALAQKARALGIPIVLDAGSVHPGTLGLLGRIDALVASRRFAQDLTGTTEENKLADCLGDHAPIVVVTLGPRGLVWKREETGGRLGAYPVQPVDSTGAGDAFHGAFAAGWAKGMAWPDLLHFASAAGAICCTITGARPGMPTRASVATWSSRPPSIHNSHIQVEGVKGCPPSEADKPSAGLTFWVASLPLPIPRNF